MVETKSLKITVEGKEIEVPENIANMSVILKEFLEDDQLSTVLTTDVRGVDFEHVLQYAAKVLERGGEGPVIEKPIKSNDMSVNLSEQDQWFATWIDEIALKDKEYLFGLAIAANYLDIKKLLELASAKIASMIKGKEIQFIRDFFGVVNDFCPEEEAWIEEENKWAE